MKEMSDMNKYLLDKAVELTAANLQYNALSAISAGNVESEAATPNQVMQTVMRYYVELRDTDWESLDL
ncbi:hypothetical protein [Schleiferilactobacillus harbinensis]|uniref:hypothetical protein n=1 Tax=Schleiferilactobacillus harbinensis TaxID=304207 RepID=UPI00186AE31A|nr:hypothetical protein [Schleiferilactobacillus harbinensis]